MQALKDGGLLVISAEYAGHLYGIRVGDLQAIENSQKIPILIVTPDSVQSLNGQNTERPFLTVFIDSPDQILDSRLKGRPASDPKIIADQRLSDRAFKSACIYCLDNIRLEATVELLRSLWDYAQVGGVVSERLINLMITCGVLLERASPESVSGASYDLSLGDEYFYAGKIHYLSEREPILTIEPYDYAIVTSHETAALPRDISGRFDLAINLFCQGVILSNGPQVDPGFKGPLFCLLFNTSSSPVLLKRRQHYATIEFHKLFEPTYAYQGKYLGKTLLDYLPSNAARGAINELKKELELVRGQSERLQNMTWAILSLVLALIAIWITLR